MSRPPLPAWLLLAVAVLGFAAATLGVAVPATDGQRAAVDETQYLLTALSIAEDGDLDISDELAFQRWRSFADEAPPQQTAIRADGSAISPHDPLLPLLLAWPVSVGGWLGAKVALACLAGLLAAVLLWTAVRRFGVPVPLAAGGVAIAAASAPLAVYGQQLYPELPAALLILCAVALLAGPPSRAGLAGLVTVLATVPWLSVKYVPVLAVLALLGAWRWRGQAGQLAAAGGVLAAAGAAYLAVHRAVWGGWTVYASGDHFVERGGEFAVVGDEVDLSGRALRITGLLLDRDYGLVAWQPAYLLVVPAVGALGAVVVLAVRGRRRSVRVPASSPVPDEWPVRPTGLDERATRAVVLLVPLTAGWLVATFVASTMHGFWWPGRHVVAVLPLAVLAILVWLTDAGRATRLVALVAGLAGVAVYAVLLVAGRTSGFTWVLGLDVVSLPWRVLLPDYRGGYGLLHACWLILLLGLIGSVLLHPDHLRSKR
ncbi:MAG: hypothetical protein AB7V44_13090 [Pseudonocardia sp.]